MIVGDVGTVGVAALPDTAGETLAFPTIQVCEEGEYAWIQVAAEKQDPHDLDEPAPLVALSAPAGSGDHGHDDHAGDDAGACTDTLTWVALGAGALGVILGGLRSSPVARPDALRVAAPVVSE